MKQFILIMLFVLSVSAGFKPDSAVKIQSRGINERGDYASWVLDTTESFVLIGLPIIQAYNFIDTIYHTIMKDVDAKKCQMKLFYYNGQAFWTNLRGLKLTRTRLGEFLVFSCSFGYIKIDLKNGSYMEHVAVDLSSITYHGFLK